MKAVERYIAVMDKINRVLQFFVAACLTALIVAVFGQVIARMAHISVPYLDEMARYVNLYMGFVAAAIGVRTNGLIKIDTVHMALKGKARLIVVEISRVISLVFIILMVYSGFLLTQVGMGQISPTLRIDMSSVYCIIPITFAFSVLNWFADTFERMVERRK